MKTIRKDATTISNVALNFEEKGRDAKMNEGPTLVALLGVPIGRRFRKEEIFPKIPKGNIHHTSPNKAQFHAFWKTYFIRKILH